MSSEPSDGIFDAAFFPRASDMAEVALGTEICVDFVVECELGSVVIGDGLAHIFGSFRRIFVSVSWMARAVLLGCRWMKALRERRSWATRMN